MIIIISAFHFIMGTQSLFMITITIAVFHQYHHYRYHVEHCSASGTVGGLTDIGTKSDVCRVDSLLILDDRHHHEIVFLCAAYMNLGRPSQTNEKKTQTNKMWSPGCFNSKSLQNLLMIYPNQDPKS